MNASPQPKVRFLHRQGIQLAFLLVLLALAMYLWTGPARTEHALQASSLAELEAIVRRRPEDPLPALYLGQRWRQLGGQETAHKVLEIAALHSTTDERAWIAWAATTTGPAATSDSIRLLSTFLQQNPDSAQAHLARGKFYREAGQRDLALQEADTALRTLTQEPEAWKLKGSEAAAQGHLPEAEQALRKAIALKPDDWRAFLGLGGILLAQKQEPEALKAYREAMRLAPEEPLPYRVLGVTLQRISPSPEGLHEAEEFLRKADALDKGRLPAPPVQEAFLPRNAGEVSEERLLADADWLLAQNRTEEAKRAYLALLSHNPNSAHAAQGAGLASQKTNDLENAFRFLRAAVQKEPRLHQAQSLLAGWYLEVGLSRQAIRMLEAAVREVPANATYWHQLGMAYVRLDTERVPAENALHRAVELEPENALFTLDYADALAGNGKQTAAETAYRAALTLAPGDADTLSRFGGFLLNGQATPAHQAEAEKLLRRALEINIENDYALYQLGRLLFERGNNSEAILLLTRAVKLVPDIAEPWYTLSRALSRSGNEIKAKEAMTIFRNLRKEALDKTHLTELINLHPSQATLQLRLARIYAGQGENARAINRYRVCLRLDPGNIAIQREVASLETRLNAAGKMPPMALFDAILATAEAQ